MNRTTQRAYMSGGTTPNTGDDIKEVSELSSRGSYDDHRQQIPFDVDYSDRSLAFPGGLTGAIAMQQPNYANPKNLFHNNVSDKVLHEQVFENRLFIDSEIRDYARYRDPFAFVVKFNSVQPKYQNVAINIGGTEYSYQKCIQGDGSIIFDKVFRNVNSASINTLFMPHIAEFKTNEDGLYEKTDRKLGRMYYRYIVLKIKELSNGRSYSNNPAIGNGTFIMKVDDETCIKHHRWIPLTPYIAFPESKPINLDRLTIDICTDRGEPFMALLDDKPHDFYNEYFKLIDTVKILKANNDETAIIKLVPKLDILKHITSFLSPELHISISTREPSIHTAPQYR